MLKNLFLVIIFVLSAFSYVICGNISISDLTEENSTAGNIITTSVNQEQNYLPPARSFGRVTNITTALNVRELPWGKIIGEIKNNTVVEIIDFTPDNKWAIILYKNKEAYIYASYLRENNATPQTQKGYVTTGFLNVRKAIWGEITGVLTENSEVTIIDKQNEWYQIIYQNGNAWVHSKYISLTPPQNNNNTNNNTPSQVDPETGLTEEQQNISNKAHSLIGSTRFRGPEVDYGNLACAQFVTTALKEAGAIDFVNLSVSRTKAKLLEQGWKTVPVTDQSQFKTGDVVIWGGYAGRTVPSHIGIIVQEGPNTYKAIDNSSSHKKPLKRNLQRGTNSPILFVLRHPNVQ